MRSSQPAIELTDVCKSFRIPQERRDTVREHALALFRPRRFRRLEVLDSVNLSIARGETLGIMGRNGCGKSTLLRIIAGIYQPDRGQVVRRSSITPILELGVGWNPELTAVDNIFLLGTVMGLSLAELHRTIPAILAFAGLEGFAELELKHFSTGMASRLAYAVAFFAVTGVLILDEVLAVGDAAFKRVCYRRMDELRAAGHGAILVSHVPHEIARFCDRALLLDRGQVALEGSGEEIGTAYLELTGSQVGSTPGSGA